MTWVSYPLLFGTGLVAGVINVFAGGGSALTLPVLILVGLPAAVANGTNRIALVCQNVMGVTGFQQKGAFDFKLSRWLVLAIVPGALLGALVSVRLDDELFRKILAFVILGVVVATVFGRRGGSRETSRDVTVRQRWAAMALLFLAGFYMGFIQAGVGFLIIGALSLTTNLDLVRINAQKLAIVLVGSGMAFLVFLSEGKIAWVAGLCLAAGNSLGGYVGSHMAVAGGEIWAKRILVGAAVILAVWMFV